MLIFMCLQLCMKVSCVQICAVCSIVSGQGPFCAKHGSCVIFQFTCNSGLTHAYIFTVMSNLYGCVQMYVMHTYIHTYIHVCRRSVKVIESLVLNFRILQFDMRPNHLQYRLYSSFFISVKLIVLCGASVSNLKLVAAAREF